MEALNSITFDWRSITTKGSTPTPRSAGLAVAVNDNIYYFGGRTDDNGSINEVSCAVIHVFNTRTQMWARIDTKPPAERCSEIFLYGTAVGTDIWLLDQTKWYCFDTVQGQWRAVNMKLPCYTATVHSFAVVLGTIMFLDTDINSFEKKIICTDANVKTISTHAAGFGDNPEERHDTFLMPLSDDILLFYGPFPNYQRDEARARGELFYYDMNEIKWARAHASAETEDQEAHSLNMYSEHFLGRIGSWLLFITAQKQLWVLDISTHSWRSLPIKGVDGSAAKISYATRVGDVIYCWMNDGNMCAIDMRGVPSPSALDDMDQVLVQVAEKELTRIKRSVKQIDTFVPEPIVLDTGLEPVNHDKLTVHREMKTTFQQLFPIIDASKLVDSTVPAPSDSVLLHKNYIHYLTLAWSNHFSVILSPDIVFYTVLCEIADEILTHPDAYRHLFTDSTQKKGLLSINHDETKIDLNQIIAGIAQNSPVDASIFMADFSSSTAESRLAIQAAFCEAMSAYYFYMSTCCGIPRVKVLGTKSDWETVEHKVRRMRTEVFGQDATTDKTLSTYLARAETQINMIHTTRDAAFWKDMFAIDNCMSGHTDVVKGWITQLYRNGYSEKYRSVVSYTGDDFYNYKAHISSVKWRSIDTDKCFELKSGLLYSNVVRGDSDDDKKFPWLEPQFCHLIVDAANGKMTPEQYKVYIDTLKGKDKRLLLDFYEVLKDDPLEFVKGGEQELVFKYTIIGRQIDAWYNEYLKTGRGEAALDFNEAPFTFALSYYGDLKADGHAAADVLAEKIVRYLKTNVNIKVVDIQHQNLIPIEDAIVRALIGTAVEELHVCGQAEESIAQLLLHPQCALKTLDIGGRSAYFDDDDTPCSQTLLASALLKTAAPLTHLVIDQVREMDLALAIKELCNRPNGLKSLTTDQNARKPFDILAVLLKAAATSKTLESVSLPDLGRHQVVVDNRKEWVDIEDAALIAFVIEHLPQNPSLTQIDRCSLKMTPEQLSKALSIPSLRRIRWAELSDLSFLPVTRQLSKLNVTLACDSAEKIAPLSQFLAQETCPLTELIVERSSLFSGAQTELAKGLVKNKSLKQFNLRKSKLNPGESKTFTELISSWFEQPYFPLTTINLQEMGLVFEGEALQRLLKALVKVTTLQELNLTVRITNTELGLLTEVISTNTTLSVIDLAAPSRDENNKFNAAERTRLCAAIQTSDSLKSIQAYFLGHDEGKQRYQFSADDFFLD